jgi:hypothetical protein
MLIVSYERKSIIHFCCAHCKKPGHYEMLLRALELAGCCEHGNEPLGSIKGRKFLDQPSDN